MIGKMRRSVFGGGVLALCLTGSAGAVVVGPAVNNSYTGTDSAGQRINVDQSNPLVLSPGTYTASVFNFFATTTGPATPFLVASSDTANPNPAGDVDAYRILAVGSTVAAAPVAGTNTVQTVPFGCGGIATFTLSESTKVFAAVSSGAVDNTSSNAIGFITGQSVDHHNPNPTQFTPTVGGTIPTFTNPDLGRIYGFSIDVVPEPASAGLLGLGAVGLLARRRRT